MNLRILFSPAHFVFDEISRGSELSWTFNIAHRISNKFRRSVVITGFKNISSKKHYKIVTINPGQKNIDLGIFNSLLFNLKYSSYSFFLLRKQIFDVHHHLLPFSIGRTFNIFRVYGFMSSSKFIIGPIQSPLPEYDDNIHDFSSKQKSNAISAIIKKTIFIMTKDFLYWLSVKTMQSADLLITIDTKTKKTLANIGIENSKIIVITPGVDTTKFIPTVRKKPSKKINILTVSYLISRKNIPTIFTALLELKKLNILFSLQVVGDGPQLKELKKLAKELNLVQEIVFEGFVDNNKIAVFYSQADIFVTMSKHESWGQMYLEAMASGLPVLSFPNTGAKNILKPTFSFLPKSDIELAKKIIHLSKDREKMKKMGSEARKNALALYDWEKTIIPQYISSYTQVVATNNQSKCSKKNTNIHKSHQ